MCLTTASDPVAAEYLSVRFALPRPARGHAGNPMEQFPGHTDEAIAQTP